MVSWKKRSPFEDLRSEGWPLSPGLFLRLLHRPSYAYELALELYGGRDAKYVAMKAGKLSSLLREMEEKGLLRSEEKYYSKDGGLTSEVKGRRRIYYTVNPDYLVGLANNGKEAILEKKAGQVSRDALDLASRWIIGALPLMGRPWRETRKRIEGLRPDPWLVVAYLRDLADEVWLGHGLHSELKKAKEEMREALDEKKNGFRDLEERLEESIKEAREEIDKMEKEKAELGRGDEVQAGREWERRERWLHDKRTMLTVLMAYRQGAKVEGEYYDRVSGYYEGEKRRLEGQVKHAQEKYDHWKKTFDDYAGECLEGGYLDIWKLEVALPKDDKILAEGLNGLSACLNAYVLLYSYTERGLLPRHLQRRLAGRLAL